MPFSINGTFTIINTFVPQTPILSADVNENYDDIADGMTELWSRTTETEIVTQIFTASGTYIPTDGMLSAIIECVGGGASGGGATSSPSDVGTAGGGGGGGYSRKNVSTGDIGASKTVTIGAGGAAPTAGANNGNNGGVTSVGVLCIANGGTGGEGSAGGSARVGGAGGVVGTGDVTTPGQGGGYGPGASIITVILPSGAGGNSRFGMGGASVASNAFSNGLPGGRYGGGGSGGSSTANTTGPVAGGAGADGVVIITELVGPA